MSPCNNTADGQCKPCSRGMFKPDTSAALNCSACSETCDTGEYISQNCSATADRVCSDCVSQCDAGFYLNPCTNFSSGSCVGCSATSFKTESDLTATSCTNCTVCQSGTQFYSQNCSRTSNAVCDSCTSTCPPGQRLIPCTNFTQGDCVACEDGKFKTGQNSDTTCTACSTCAANQFVLQNCTSSSNTVCGNCTLSCQAGFYLTPCTSTTSGNCTACGDGTFKLASTPAATSCTSCTLSCPVNQYITSNCTSSQDITCGRCLTSCPAGQYLEPCTQYSNGTCKSCTLGQDFKSLAGNSTRCTACTASCAPGMYMSKNCTLTSDAECTPCSPTCPAGKFFTGCTTFQNSTCTDCEDTKTFKVGSNNQTFCDQCSSECDAPDQYISANCTKTSNRACLTCLKECGPGLRVRPCTLLSNAACIACANGTFKNNTDNRTDCTTCTATCPSGQYVSANCTPTSDLVCSPCLSTCGPGTYLTNCTTFRNAVCVNCSATTYKPGSDGLQSCFPCATSCPSNATFSSFISTNCTRTSDAVCSQCLDQCDSGKYLQTCSTFKNGSCPACNTGFWKFGLDGRTSCSQCSPGCPPFQYISEPCTLTSERVCGNCLTSCGPSLYLSPCTLFTNGTCQSCSATSYKGTTDNSTSCLACSTTCPPAQYFFVNCTRTADRVCAGCLSSCGPGQFLQNCTKFQDGSCVDCNSTSYKNGTDSRNSCYSCSGLCPAGVQFQSVNCTRTSDRVCTSCFNQCGPGQALSTCTSYTDGFCYNCSSTSYKNGTDSSTTCKSCSLTCGTRQFISINCTRTSDRVCSNCSTCPADQYFTKDCSLNGGDTVCAPCAVCAVGLTRTSTSCLLGINSNCTGEASSSSSFFFFI